MRAKLRGLWSRLRGTLRRDAESREVQEEFRFHIEQATARNLARGMPPEQALREARRHFGGVSAHREAAADEQRSRGLESVLRDIRYALRTLRKHPGFTAAMLLTVALGIGANTAVFSVVNGVLLRPLPFPAPGHLLYVGWDYGNGRSIQSLSFYQMAFLRERARGLEGIATYNTTESVLGDPQAFETARGLRVSADFFRVIGLAPVAGRSFAPAEHRPGLPDVVILGDGFWRARFGARPAALGQLLRLDERSYTIVGIMPPGFKLPDAPESADFVIPLQTQPDRRDEGQNYTVLARFGRNITREQLTADLSSVSRAFTRMHPDLAGPRAAFAPLSFQDVFAGNLPRLLWVLFGAVGFVALIACVNAANLLLARATTREREIAIRAAIGAGRGRIIRQLLIESVVLSLAAGALGLVFGIWGVKALLALAPRELPRVQEIGLDWRVAGFTAALAMLTGLAFGLVSALPGTRAGLLGSLTRGSRGDSGGGRRAREALIVVETAVAVVLLAAAGLLITSFARLRAVDSGLDPANVLAASIRRVPAGYWHEGRPWEFERRALEQIRALPGVEAAATLANFPFERGLNFPMTIAGRPEDSEGAVELRLVSAGYFETLRVPLLLGRGLPGADAGSSARVAIINAAMARRYWPGENPLGKRIDVGRWKGQWLGEDFQRGGTVEVVGVAADVREIGLAQPVRRTIYLPRAQWGGMLSRPRFVIRTAPGASVQPLVTDLIHRVDPEVQAPAFETLAGILSASIAEQRFQTILLAAFAGGALLLTAIGIYGVVASAVTGRTREIGIRMALGARRQRVLGLIVGRGMLLVAGGAVLGILGAVGLTRLLAGMLFGVSPTDPQTLAVAVLVLIGVALVAAWIPGRRATRVNPTVALRAE